MNEKTKIKVNDLYKLCNKERMFTCGTTKQYEKMFELAEAGITRMELAYILYLCSDYRLDVIYRWITPLFECDWKCCHCGTGYRESDPVQCAEYMGSCVCEPCAKKDFIEKDGELVLKPKKEDKKQWDIEAK